MGATCMGAVTVQRCNRCFFFNYYYWFVAQCAARRVEKSALESWHKKGHRRMKKNYCVVVRFLLLPKRLRSNFFSTSGQLGFILRPMAILGWHDDIAKRKNLSVYGGCGQKVIHISPMYAKFEVFKIGGTACNRPSNSTGHGISLVPNRTRTHIYSRISVCRPSYCQYCLNV